MIKIKLEKYETRYYNFQCTDKQWGFIRSLMNNSKYEKLWLNKLAFDGQNKLTIASAKKLIDCLLNQKDFILVEDEEEGEKV